MITNSMAARQETASEMMQRQQNAIWQLLSKASIKSLSPASLDVHAITSRLDHVERASKLPPGPP